MKRLSLFFLTLVVGLTGACTTMESIQSGEPSYVLRFSNVERSELSQCAADKINEKAAYDNIIRETSAFDIIETYSVGSVIPLPNGGLSPGPGVPYFATRFYDNRVEVYGRPSISGDYGKNFIPLLQECISELGGELND